MSTNTNFLSNHILGYNRLTNFNAVSVLNIFVLVAASFINKLAYYISNIFGIVFSNFNSFFGLTVRRNVFAIFSNTFTLKKAITFCLIFFIGFGINSLKGQTPKIKNVKTPLNAIPSIPSNSSNSNNLELYPGTFQGAEIFYKQITDHEIEIFLTKYFNCETLAIDSFENVNIFETIANVSSQTVSLKLFEVTEKIPTNNISCISIEKSCVKKLTYSGKVNIMNPMFGGYDITWGICCWDNAAIKNIEGMQESKKQGLALHIHIPDLRGGEMNSSPVFNNNPILTSCKGQLLATNLMADDNDKDSLVFEFSAIDNYTTEKQYKPVPDPELITGQFQQKSFAANKPPFKKVLYKKNYSAAKPLGGGKQLSINTKTGEIQLKADSIGDFLIGISVKEIRNKKELGTYQRVYKLKVIE